MRIMDIIAVPASGAYYYEDLAALQARSIPLAERYRAPGVTPGFRFVRQPAEAVSVGLIMEDGEVAWGDCVSVVYSGKAGRDPLFRNEEGCASVMHAVAPWLRGKELKSFRELAGELDALTETITESRRVPPPPKVEKKMSRRDLLTAPLRVFRDEPAEPAKYEQIQIERRLHTAVRYGVSQALLRAVARSRRLTMAEVLAEEWGLPRPAAPVPIHAQCGGERYNNADKMIIRRIASLPHALVDDIPEQLGDGGHKLTRYARWLKDRIHDLGGEEYWPTIHLDVHGAFWKVYEQNLGKVLGQFYALEQAVAPYALRIESPMVLESRQEQIEKFARLRELIRLRKMTVRLVADEWANTLEDIQAFIAGKAADMIQIKMPDMGSIHNSVDAVLLCQAGGVEAFLGGSCAETNLSAEVAVHVALATRPAIIMARPGLGVDESIMLTSNEMARTLAILARRPASQPEA